MNKTWTVVPVGDILTERREKPSPEDLASGSVRIISKISFSSGILELRSDSETKTGMILAYPGDLVVSGINAAKGAIAIYGKENVEPVAATIHYGAYTPNPEKADLQYLWYFFRSQVFQRILEDNIPGGIKTELKAKRLLPIPIPLPPLEEQRRIVVRIEELSTAIGEARGLRQQSIKNINIFWPQILNTCLTGFDSTETKNYVEPAQVLLEKSSLKYKDFLFNQNNNAHPHLPVIENLELIYKVL